MSISITTQAITILNDQPHNQYDAWLETLYGHLEGKQDIKRKIDLPRPQTGRIGSKITRWDNFASMCTLINREPKHVSEYIGIELCTTTALTDTNQLKILYRLGTEKACQIFAKYITEWVRCQSCRSMNTTLSKHPVGRYNVIHCVGCLCDVNKFNK